jgi:hypothetical protein
MDVPAPQAAAAKMTPSAPADPADTPPTDDARTTWWPPALKGVKRAVVVAPPTIDDVVEPRTVEIRGVQLPTLAVALASPPPL